VRSARTRFDSPIGMYEVEWAVDGENKMRTRVCVPANGRARVRLIGVDEVVGSDEYVFNTRWEAGGEWHRRRSRARRGMWLSCLPFLDRVSV
jgi:alpha-L-rhamnosidase